MIETRVVERQSDKNFTWWDVERQGVPNARGLGTPSPYKKITL